MKYWLLKSEPDVFSIDHLQKVGTEPWDGIRNYQARNFMRDDMSIGDLAFFYHSNCKVPGIVGIMRVASEPYPDPFQFDKSSNYFDPKSSKENPRWLLRDFTYVDTFKRVVSLTEIKANPKFSEMRLVQKGSRLSIMPVEKKHWDMILALA